MLFELFCECKSTEATNKSDKEDGGGGWGKEKENGELGKSAESQRMAAQLHTLSSGLALLCGGNATDRANVALQASTSNNLTEALANIYRIIERYNPSSPLRLESRTKDLVNHSCTNGSERNDAEYGHRIKYL